MNIRLTISLAAVLLGCDQGLQAHAVELPGDALNLVSPATIEVPKHHKSIQAAIDAAAPGDTVLVAAGSYRERVRLKDGVTLRSAGDDAKGKLGLKRAEVTIIDGGGKDGEGPGVAMAEGSTLDGFTVTNVGVYDDAEWNKHHTTQGSDQPHEHIGQPGTAGIGVVGVNCSIQNNIVHHIGYSGIAIQGVEGQRCSPRVWRNVCYRNMGGGIGSMRGSTAIIEGNICFQNFYAGIGHEGSSPLVVKNVCYENIRAGIGISEGSKPVVRGNECFRNRRAGIGIRTGADTSPVVEDNNCHHNDMAGIGCEEGCTPLVRNNRCHENALAGIGCRDNARPLIVGNQCFKNQEVGIGFDDTESAEAFVINNRVADNDKVAVGIHSGWKVRLIGNELSRPEGMPPVVMVFAGAEADFTDNTIRGSGVAGIRAEGKIRATGNRIESPALRAGGPPQFAVWGLPGSSIVFTGNSVRGWRHGLFADKAAVTACENSIANYGTIGIKIQEPSATAIVVGNTLESETGREGVKVTGGQAVVENNRVEPPKQTGEEDADASDDREVRPPLAQSPLPAEQVQEIQHRWAKHIGKEVEHTNSIGMKLVLLPPGEFTMGRSEKQLDELLDTVKNNPEMKRNYGGQVVWSMLMMPAHRVRLTKPFYMGATEVTVGQFRQFADATGYKTEAEQGLDGGEPFTGNRPICTWRKPMVWINLQQKDDEPVLHLCYNDCVEFCKWLSKKEGVEYCLPTEAEWEYACRAGTTTPWSFGDWQDVPRVAHEYAYWSEAPQGKHDRPRSVAQGKPNAFGLYDMHGNVWEYVADWWHRMYYKESPLNDPTGPDTQDELNRLRRIIRGSSFDWDSWGGDSAYRMRIGQRSTQHPHMGFRVAMLIKGVKGVPPAVDPDETRRSKRRDPGADSKEVRSALSIGAITVKDPEGVTIDLGYGVTMEFVLIPAGSFLMGSDKGLKDERPVHRVVISKPFYMAKHELTQGQWETLMGKHPWLEELRKDKANDAVGPTKAIDTLSWTACQEYVGKLKAKVPGYAFALPTEAQWEYACRAGSTTEYSFGDDPAALGEYAWFHGNMNWVGQPGFRGQLFYHDVGKKKPNAFGLYDMHGGVWEWCADWYDPDYYLAAPLTDPSGPDAGRFRVLRGGSWFRYAKYARSSYRKFFHPDGDGDATTAYINDFGCRLVINLDAANSPGAGRGSADQSRGPGNYTQLARSLVRHSQNPVIKVGEKGMWDDQTLGCFAVLDDGDTFYFYSEGSQYGKPKKIGLATSHDGITWTKHEKNPLFPGSMPHAIKVGDVFRLYYPHAGGLQMRTARDGIQWSEPRKIMGGHMDPYVIRVAENRFHLYYCDGGRKSVDGKQVWEFKNYMATSPDGITWDSEPESLLPLGPKGSWDSQSHAGPCVLKLPDGFHMWYLGSGPYHGKTAWRIGHATSPDARLWTKSGDEPVLDIGKPGDWDGGTFLHIEVIFRDGKFLFWYAGAATEHGDETKMKIQIGHGTSQ